MAQLEIVTIEDLERVKNELMGMLKLVQQDVKAIKRKKRWLKSGEFMELYNIKTTNTLKLMREQGIVKAEMRLSEWYYDTDSFLPS